MDTFKFEWMNGGQPFDLATHRLTPAAYRAAATAKTHAFAEAAKIATSDMVPEVRAVIVEDAKSASVQAQGDALIYGALCAIDAKVKDLGISNVIGRLDFETYSALTKAITKGIKIKAASPAAAADPNAQPPPS